jgi:hypothetical protein
MVVGVGVAGGDLHVAQVADVAPGPFMNGLSGRTAAVPRRRDDGTRGGLGRLLRLATDPDRDPRG